jgi:acyl carrier protein
MFRGGVARAAFRDADAEMDEGGDGFRTGGEAAMNDEIRAIVREHGRLSVNIDTLKDDSDLYQAGMTSHASVNVMLALEGAFDIEFPDRMLKRGVFESISSMRSAIDELKGGR